MAPGQEIVERLGCNTQPLYLPAEATLEQLVALQLRVAQADYATSKAAFQPRLWLVAGVVLTCCILAAGLGLPPGLALPGLQLPGT